MERTELPEPTGLLLVDLDWRSNGGDYTTPAKDQQQCGACWSFAAIGALESMVEIANSNPGMNPDLSEQYPLSCTGPQGICPNDCVSGGNAYWAFWYMGTAAPQNGGLPESCFPYAAVDANGCDFNGCGLPPVLCNAKCATWQSQLVQTITGYGFDDASATLTPQKIKNQLANGPVCLSIDVFADFNPGPGNSPSFDGNGIYRWDGVSAYVGGHAVLCVGYQDSLGCWICKNSWGAGWGNMQGFFKIAYGQCNVEYDMSWVTFTQSGGNNAPYTPSNPNPLNHATSIDVNADLSWTGGDPDSGDTVTYDVYFGTSSPPPKVVTGQSGTTYDPGTMSASTTYYWQVVSWDDHGASTSGPIWDFTTAGGSNNPPNTPSTPSGPTTGTTGVQYTYSTSAIDPNGDNVKYGWDGNGNGLIDFWTGFLLSGAICTVGITFNGAGTYYIQVMAEDINGAQSGFSPQLTVVITGSNNNPNTPSNPNPLNHATSIDVNADLSWTGGDPDSGDTVTYDVYFGTSSPPPKVVTGQSGTTYDPGTMSASTTYYWQVVSWDDHGASTSGPIWDFTTAGGSNNPPNKPSTPSGTTSGRPGNSYQYSSDATDPEGNDIYYNFSWDDGTYSGWLGPYISGDTVNTFHTWTKKGSYSIKVKAKDDHGAESVWSDPLPISMPKNKQSTNFLQQFLGQLIERFPLLEYLLDFR